MHMTGVLNLSRNYFFIHLPKCAGSSISHVLLKDGQASDFRDLPKLVEIVRTDAGEGSTRIENAGHARACDVQKFLGRKVCSQMNSFTVVRDPWERLVSRYHYQRHILRRNLPQHLQGTFEDFVVWACKHRPSTQFERLSDSQGKILVKEVLKFENLGKDFESYSFQTLGEACKLPVLNSSPTSFDGVKFSQLAVSNVQAAYKEDFLAFGYRNYPSNDRCF